MKNTITKVLNALNLNNKKDKTKKGPIPLLKQDFSLLMVGVKISIGKKTFFEDTNLLIPNGKFVIFSCRNKQQREVFLKACAGVISPDEGRLEVAGLKSEKSKTKIKEKTVFIPKTFPDRRNKTIKEYLFIQTQLAGLSREEAKKRINELSSKYRIQGALSKKPKELGPLGLKTTLLVYGLIRNPDLILIDSPFEGLEPKDKSILISYFIELKKSEKSIVVGTPEIGEEIEYCDEVLTYKNKTIISSSSEDAKKQLNKYPVIVFNLEKPPNIIPPEIAVFKPKFITNKMYITLTEPSLQTGQVLKAVMTAGFSVESIDFEVKINDG